MQQEMKMQEMLNQENQKNQMKEIENQKQQIKQLEKMEKRERLQRLKIFYKDYKPNTNSALIELHIRLPNGKRITQLFEKSQKISFVENFVLQIENNGVFEDYDEDDEEDEFGVDLLYGFPPKKLGESLTLQKCFGSSDAEAISVKIK